MEKNRIHPVAVSNGVRMSYARQQEVLEMLLWASARPIIQTTMELISLIVNLMLRVMLIT